MIEHRLAALATLVLLGLGASHGTAAERPNVVLIISDDHDYEHLGFMGNPYVHTPTLDRLAERGTVFTTAHLPMSRCHPTLASLLSGRWPHQSGIYYNFGTEKLAPEGSLPNLLKEAGYATYVGGKYWEGPPPTMGFTHGGNEGPREFVRNGQGDLFSFVDEAAGKQPMFVWWAPMIPHTPHDPPQRYLDLYDASELPIPDYVPPDALEGGLGTDGFRHKELVSYAMEAWLDDGLSQLIEKLRSVGQHDNTLYVFLIDNGWCNGLVSKGSPFEKGVRSPVVLSLPGAVPEGQRFDDLVSTLDLFPTILDYAGVEIPEGAVGRSLRPRVEGRAHEPREVLYGAIYPAFVTKGDERPERDVYALYARTERWKYILFIQDVVPERNREYFRIQSILTDYPAREAGAEDLYDLRSDPYEQNDLAHDSAHEARLAELRESVLAWWKQTGGRPLPGP